MGQIHLCQVLKHLGSGPGRIPVPAKIPFGQKSCCFHPQIMAPSVWQQPHFLGDRAMALTETQWLYGLAWEMEEVAFWRLWFWACQDQRKPHDCNDLLNFSCQWLESFVPSYNLVLIRHVYLEPSADYFVGFYCYLTQKSVWLGRSSSE